MKLFASLLFAIQNTNASQPNTSIQILIFLLLFLGMWFLMIAPQRKRQKQHTKMIQELKNGDDVITNSGIYATIVSVKADRFVLKIADNVKVEFHKASIQGKLQSSEK